ncbi:HAD family hydrolase [Streptomyces sp. NPDC002431]
MGWDLRATFAHHGLGHYFSSWVHSYEHDTERPDPLLFQHACRERGVAPEETLMVGDHPAKDGGAAGAGLRQWRPLQRYTGPREDYAETHAAIASLVSDRSARRPARRKPSTEFVLAR